ncbi:MAG: DUF2341 domain-containing protein, partial [Rubripirellula sp.]
MPDKLHQWCQRWLISADEVGTRAKGLFGKQAGTLQPSLALQLSDLEPRILFSASPIDPSMMPDGDEVSMVVEAQQDSAEDTAESAFSVAVQASGEIIFIDSAVPDIESLLDDLRASGRDSEVFILDAERDGVDQITEILETRSDLSSIHIVSHADDAAVRLGGTMLSDSNLAGYAGQIASWKSSLALDSDILFYGCDLAGNADGQLLLESLSTLTGADVAASVDDTGQASLGGDWDLEFTTGSIETTLAFSQDVQANWQGLLTLGAYDGFDYVVGSLDGANGGSGWATAWTTLTGSSANVVASGLTDPTGDLATIGGAAQMDTSSLFKQSRELQTAIGMDGTTTWFSFLVEADTSSGGISLHVGDDGGSDDTVSIGTSGDGFLLAKNASPISGASSISNVINDGQTYLLVARIDFASGDDTVTLFIDPTPGLASPDTGGALTTQLTGLDLGTFTEVGWIGGFSSNNSTVDELRVGNSFADVAPLETTEVTLATIQDTYIDKNSAGPFGSSSTITVGAQGGEQGNIRSLVQFDFSSIPVGSTITSATLQLEATGIDGSVNVGVYELSEAWSESTASWNNPWAAGGTFSTTAVDTFSASSTGLHEWDLTNLVIGWQNGSVDNHGVLLASEDTGSDSVTYSSREGSTAPALLVTYLAPNSDPTVANSLTDQVATQGSSFNFQFAANSFTDVDGDPLTYTATLSDSNSLPSWLVFNAATRTFSGTPTNGDVGTISIRVTANDGNTGTVFDDFSLEVTNVAPTINSTLTPSVVENTALVQTVTTIEPDATVGFTITGGADASLFTINAAGELSFVAAADFEKPKDLDFDNQYEVEVTSSDGIDTDVASILVTVTDANDNTPVGTADAYVVDEDTTLNSNAGWFDVNWSFRRTLSFDNSGQSETLAGFPVLIQLDSSRIDYSQTLNAGEDLRFVDGDGTLLAHEIEVWNEGGTSYVWVRVPQIAQSSASDFVWMYYGNATATDAQDSAAVWAGYDAVQHLNNNALDSTANNNDGTITGSVNASGRFGDSQSFDGDNDIINLGQDASLGDVFQAGGTVSAWFNAADWGQNGHGRILDKANGVTPGGGGWNLSLSDSNESVIFEFGRTAGIERWRAEPNAISLNQWHNVTIVFNSDLETNDPQIYIDGVLQTLTTPVTGTGSAPSDQGIDLAIGNHASGLSRGFEGLIDEVQLMDGVRSADWINAQYLAATENFVTFGAQQTTAGVLGNDIDADGNLMTAVLVTGPSNHQTFNFNTDGSFTYLANDNFHGEDTFTYRANDGQQDSEVTTVTISVSSVNDTPTIGSATLGAIEVDEADPPGASVISLFGSSFTDADDPSSLVGIVVIQNDAVAGTEGVWQYTSNGTQWENIGTVNDTGSGLVLSAASKVRFLSATGYDGTPTGLSVRGLDNSFTGAFSSTAGTENRQVHDTSNASDTAFSAVATLNTFVSVNHLPEIGGVSSTVNVDDDATAQPFTGVTIVDDEGDPVTVVVTLSGGDANGEFTAASLLSSGFVKHSTNAGEYTLSAGTPANAQSAIRQLVFAPTSNQVTPATSVSTTLTITVNDGLPTVNSETTVVTTSINDAPAIAPATLAAVDQKNADPSGTSVSSLFGPSFVDADASASFAGIVVVQNDAVAGTQGVWQYSSDGSQWENIGAVNDTGNGLVLNTSSQIRFLPVISFSGTPASLSVRGLDDSFSGTFSSTAGTEDRRSHDTSSVSDTSFSAITTLSTSVTSNDSSVIDGVSGVVNVADNATTQPFSAVTITDAEDDQVTVVVTLSGGDANGQFTAASLLSSGFVKHTVNAGEYTLSAGTVADAQSAIRQLVFDPVENQVAVGSTVSTTMTITVDDGLPTVNNGTTVVAASVNDAPTISDAVLASSLEDDYLPAGGTVSSLWSSAAGDADASASLNGIVVVENSADEETEGRWEYSSDGSNWFAIGEVNGTNLGLAISSSSLLRFVPVANFHGVPTEIVVHAIDETYTGSYCTTSSGEARALVNPSGATANSAISSGTARLQTSVASVNDRPTLADHQQRVASGEVLTSGTGRFENLSEDVDGDSLTAVQVSGPSNGTLSLAPDGSFVYRPNEGFAGLDSFVWKATDGSLSSDDAVVEIRVRQTVVPLPQVAASETNAPEPLEEAIEEESEGDAEADESVEIVDVGLGVDQGVSDDVNDRTTVNPVLVEPAVVREIQGADVSDSMLQRLLETDSSGTNPRRSLASLSSVDDRIRNSLIEQLNTIDVTNADIALMTKPGLMWSQLDDHRSQMELQ